MKKFVFLLLFPTVAFANNTPATYYRFWRGFKRPDLNQESFLKKLPPFMDATIKVYKGKGLSNYIVVVPPANHPKDIPDEFALVAFDSQESYQTIRATKEGKKYADSHWDLFDKTTSKSADLRLLQDMTLKKDMGYELNTHPIDWSHGFTVFYLGNLKNPENLSAQDIFKILSNDDINGGLVLSNGRYICFFINVQRPELNSLEIALNPIADKIMLQVAQKYQKTIKPNNVYSTISN